VDGEVMDPRQRLLSVPYALRATVAERLDGAVGSVPHAVEASGVYAAAAGGAIGDRVTLLRVNTQEDGTPEPNLEGVSMYYDEHYFSQYNDALVFEKTDVNQDSPDGGIVFAHRQASDGARVTDFAVRQGKVMVGTTSPMRDFTVVGQSYLWDDQGSGRDQATIRAHHANPNAGMAAYVTNESNYATAHFENYAAGEVLFLKSNGGRLIRGIDRNGGETFWVDETGLAHVRALEIRGGADLSERFDVAATPEAPVEPGMVVAIDPANPEGGLVPSQGAYARTVAGIVAGAGGIEPGMLLYQENVAGADGDHPVALTGRVFARADTSNGPIRPGDLLTTSERTGYAMKASDWQRSQGAVIGKSLGSLDEETGLVLVLVGLQ
jgi:hypothetical protein